VTALVIEQGSLVNHSSGGSLAGSLVLLLLVIRILHRSLFNLVSCDTKQHIADGVIADKLKSVHMSCNNS
jgi:hypothetical protein